MIGVFLVKLLEFILAILRQSWLGKGLIIIWSTFQLCNRIWCCQVKCGWTRGQAAYLARWNNHNPPYLLYDIIINEWERNQPWPCPPQAHGRICQLCGLLSKKSIQIELNNNYIAEKFSLWAHPFTTTPNSQSKEQVSSFHILLFFLYPSLF